MALAIWQKFITDTEGNIIPNATVEVRSAVAGFPLADLYSDRDGLVTKANPFMAEDDGLAEFFVAGGAYRVTVTSAERTATFEYVAVGTAAETDAGLLPSATPAKWVFDDATADADPGPTEFRLNNATPGSATAAYIDNLQVGAVDASAWLDLIDDFGTTSSRGVLEIFDPTQPTQVFHRWLVTGSVVDGTGYRKLTIAYLSGQGAFVVGAEYSIVFWATGPQGDVPATRAINTSTGLTGGGNLSADRTLAIDKASDAEVRSGSATPDQVLTNDLIESASAAVALTDAATVAVDWDTFINATLQLSGNRVLGNPTNGQPGTWRTVLVRGDAASSPATQRTLTFGNQYKGDIPTLTDIDDHKWYLLMIFCVSTTHFVVSSKEAKNALIP